jgi:hypothetical protein
MTDSKIRSIQDLDLQEQTDLFTAFREAINFPESYAESKAWNDTFLTPRGAGTK